jgi:hypothetical protein
VATCHSADARRPALHSEQRPTAEHCNSRRIPTPPSKSRNSSPLFKGRKEVISTTTRTLQGITYPAYPSLRKTAGAPGGERPQNTNYRGTRD